MGLHINYENMAVNGLQQFLFIPVFSARGPPKFFLAEGNIIAIFNG